MGGDEERDERGWDEWDGWVPGDPLPGGVAASRRQTPRRHRIRGVVDAVRHPRWAAPDPGIPGPQRVRHLVVGTVGFVVALGVAGFLAVALLGGSDSDVSEYGDASHIYDSPAAALSALGPHGTPLGDVVLLEVAHSVVVVDVAPPDEATVERWVLGTDEESPPSTLQVAPADLDARRFELDPRLVERIPEMATDAPMALGIEDGVAQVVTVRRHDTGAVMVEIQVTGVGPRGYPASDTARFRADGSLWR